MSDFSRNRTQSQATGCTANMIGKCGDGMPRRDKKGIYCRFQDSWRENRFAMASAVSDAHTARRSGETSGNEKLLSQKITRTNPCE